jgi:FAD/FMN-containing dehydrogenase
MTKVFPTAFDKDCRISNARFEYVPSVICYCYNEADVIEALRFAKGKPVRVRAGGHHHEGMCSGPDVVMIDVSNIKTLDFDRNTKTIRLGPGVKLGDVYKVVLKEGFLFPGGACDDVHVGGVVQGGGWGLFTRALGLTCDWVRKFRIVTRTVKNNQEDFEGTWVEGAAADPNRDLYWAVCGGGGGNFGIPVEFVFGLVPFQHSNGPGPSHVTQFTANYADRSLVRDVIDGWMRNFPRYDDRLTTFCRVIAPGTEDLGDKPSLILGNFIGDQGELSGILDTLLPRRKAAAVAYTQVAVWPPTPTPAASICTHPQYQAGPPGGLTSTCATGAYFRHKVSSTYPRAPQLGADALQVIHRYINEAPAMANARRYLSLHSLGGVVGDSARNQRNCFAYRDRPFLIQYQAWWESKDDDCTHLDWLKGFRDDMRPYVDGSFINFPDVDLVDTKDQKMLMKPYYGKNFDKLVAIKNRYDPNGIFDFPMGIPRR